LIGAVIDPVGSFAVVVVVIVVVVVAVVVKSV
jgi:hypothetical protein